MDMAITVKGVKEMKIKVKDKEFSFEGYVTPINSVQRVAERCYQQGRADERAKCKCPYWNEEHQDCSISYDEIRADERAKVLDEFRKQINEYLNESSDFADFIVTDGAIDIVIEELKEQNK